MKCRGQKEFVLRHFAVQNRGASYRVTDEHKKFIRPNLKLILYYLSKPGDVHIFCLLYPNHLILNYSRFYFSSDQYML